MCENCIKLEELQHLDNEKENEEVENLLKNTVQNNVKSDKI